MTICIVLPVGGRGPMVRQYRRPAYSLRNFAGQIHFLATCYRPATVMPSVRRRQGERALRRNRGGRSAPIRKGAIRVTRKPLPLSPGGRCALLMLPLVWHCLMLPLVWHCRLGGTMAAPNLPGRRSGRGRRWSGDRACAWRRYDGSQQF
jgi:hypothetical protein